MEGNLAFNQKMEGSIPPSPANRPWVDGLFFNGSWWYCMYFNRRWYRVRDNTGGYYFWQLDNTVQS